MIQKCLIPLLALCLYACSTAPAIDVQALSEALSQENRSQQDRARDAGRKPAEVLKFLDIRQGSTVLDIIAAGGYYTEVLSLALGPEGKVYAQNSASVLKMRSGAASQALTQRMANNRLPNVVRLDEELDQLSIEPNTLDAAITALNVHDIVGREGLDALSEVLAMVKKLLKPGGVLGIIDHWGVTGQDNIKLHRLDVEAALPTIQQSGFGISRSELLRNLEDDHSLYVFDKKIRGKTDRILLRLVKPKAAEFSSHDPNPTGSYPLGTWEGIVPRSP